MSTIRLKSVSEEVIKNSLQFFRIEYTSAVLVQNNNNCIYKIVGVGGRYILRFTPSYYRSRQEVEQEVSLIAHMRKNGLHTPSIVSTASYNDVVNVVLEDGTDTNVVLFEYIDGKHISLSKATPSVIQLYGQTLGQLHNLSESFVGNRHVSQSIGKRNNVQSFLNRNNSELSLKFEEIEYRISNHEEHILDYGFCHGDYHTNNLIHDNLGKVHVIDFENSNAFFFAYDIIILLHDFILMSPSRFSLQKFFNSYIKGYRMQRNFQSISAILFQDLFLYRTLIAYAFWGGLEKTNSVRSRVKMEQLRNIAFNQRDILSFAMQSLYSAQFIKQA